MATPFTITGALNLPADAGLAASAITVGATGSFDSESKEVLKLTGVGSHSVDMGTLPAEGAKVVLVKVDAGSSVAPVLLTINGGVAPIELAAGGVMLLSNPAPGAGVTSISIAHTTACVVRVWVLG